MRLFSIALILAILVAVAYAGNHKIVLTQESLFESIIKSDICKVDQAVVVNYKLTKGRANPVAYVTSADANLDGSACGNELKKKPASSPAATNSITALDNTDVCGLKCGGPTCLCEIGMACTATGANPCEAVIAECKSNVCVAKQTKLTFVHYSYPTLEADDVEKTRFQKAMRDAVSQFGIASHCWTEAYVYDVPTNKKNTAFRLSVMDNDVSIRGCAAAQFTFPQANVPTTSAKNFDRTEVKVWMDADTKDASLECLDVITEKFTCKSSCYAPCLANALCTSDQDCLSDNCRTVTNEDGAKLDEKRCSNTVAASLLMVVAMALLATFF
jgi:hypothetical protein